MLFTKLRKPLALVLVFLMFFSMVPFGYAAEMPASQFESGVDPPTEESLPEDETSLTEPTITNSEPDPDSVPEDTIPETESAPETDSSEPSAEDVPQDGPGIMGVSPGDSSTWAIGSTQNSIMLFDFADNGNYTTVLNSQVACAYKPNGTGTTRTAYIKNLGWHFARYGGVAYADDPLYCIEPWRSYAASTSGNSVDRDVTLDGSGSTTGSNVWYALPAARREAIGLILLYSNQMWNHSISVTTTSKANNPNVPLRIATQFLIYEIVCGLRDPSTFTLNSTNECGTAGNIFYNAGVASVTNFANNYNTLVSNIQAAKKIPSFTSASSGSAPTINLTGEETSVYDSNGVLSNFSFTDGSGAEFYKSGSTLYITQTGDISSSTVFKATRYLPSAASSTYNIWYMSGSSYQTTVSLASASSGSLNAYFKLKAPDPGTISLTKTTEDGQNLSGWRFGVYTNSACTSEVFGVLAIPALDLEMPVYLGASSQNMALGAAQLGQTSIPVGGKNTNTVIAGHRGWNGADYFRYITELVPGDRITITNLWETLEYAVVGTRIISPDDVDAIKIQPDKDMITLFTCHPYASGGRQRYLVFCERIKNEIRKDDSK